MAKKKEFTPPEIRKRHAVMYAINIGSYSTKILVCGS